MTFETSLRSRAPRGTSAGGRFEHERHAETDVRLERQRTALGTLLGGIRPARALGSAAPSPTSVPASPLARLMTGAAAVEDLIEQHGWTPVQPMPLQAARFPATKAATDGTYIVQPYAEPGSDTTCVVALPTAGAHTWTGAVYIDCRGERVAPVAPDEAQGIRRLRDADDRGDEGAPASLAVQVQRQLAG